MRRSAVGWKATLKQVSPLLILLVACSPGSAGNTEAAHDEAASEAEAHADVVHVEPENVQRWGLEVGQVEHTHVAAEVELPGVLTTNENRTARIGPLVAGQIAELRVDLGDRVRAGQTLVLLNAPEFTRAQTEFLQAFAQAELSRKDFERATVLRERQAIEEREFVRRQSIFEQDLAKLRSTEVILHSLGVDEDRVRSMAGGVDASVPVEDHTAVEALLPVQSPINGVVLTRDAILGDQVDPGQALFTVADLSSLWGQLDAYEHQLPYLDPSAEVVVRTPQLPDTVFPARITFISDQVDPELRTVRVRVEVPNSDGLLKPNMYVSGFLRVVDEDTDRFVVPAGAVQLLEGRHVVFVEAPPEDGEDHLVFEAVDVEPGETLTVGQVILGGLDGSERIVRKGAFTLKSELTKGAGGHEHVH